MKKLLFVLFALFSGMLTFAQPKEEGTAVESPEVIDLQIFAFYDSVERAMVFDSGVIELPNGIAKINLPKGYKYLNKEQSYYVLTEIWGNPKDHKTLGMIFPSHARVTTGESWVFNIDYEDIGYVEDDDASDVDYEEMMEEMKKEAAEESKNRKANGYEAYSLVGWAETPFYDSDKHVIYWGKEVEFETQENHVLNYDFRVLGRKGVLSLNAIADMSLLPEISALKNEITGMVQFNEGFAYKDFDSNIDEVAAYTVGGLVAGKILAKAGLLVFLAKFWKLILIGVAAAGGGISAIFKRKKKNEEEAAAINTNNPPENPPAE